MSVASRERQRSDALAFSEAVSEKMLIQTEGLKWALIHERQKHEEVAISMLFRNARIPNVFSIVRVAQQRNDAYASLTLESQSEEKESLCKPKVYERLSL